MPYTPAQRRLFGAQMNRGELSKKEFTRRMGEGTRTDVDKSGHAKKLRGAKTRSARAQRRGKVRKYRGSSVRRAGSRAHSRREVRR